MESPPPAAAAAVFSPGDAVEVRTSLEHRHGGWYEATVESLTPAGKYVVLYASPIDPSQPLRETVRAYRIRHRAPPGRQHFPFAVGQPVEVPYRRGWWPGEVEEVRHQRESDKRKVREYMVVVKKTGERVSCRGKHMRRLMGPAMEDSEGLTELVPRKRRKNNTPQESGAKKRMINDIMASAQVGEHQESIPVNMSSAEYDSTFGTNLVTQGDTGTKSLDGDELLNMMADVACSNLLGLSSSHPQQDEAGTDEEAILTTPRVGITGDSVHDHQETLLVNKRSVKGHSTLRTEQVTPTYIEKLDGHELSSMIVHIPVSSLLGASNSQNHHDEAEKEQEAILSTPRVGIAGDLVSPLSNESDLAVIPSIVVKKPSVEADPIPTTPLAARGDDTSMNSLDEHGSSNSMVGNPRSSLLGASNSLHQDDEAGKEHKGFASIPSTEIARDVSAPLSNGLLSEETRSSLLGASNSLHQDDEAGKEHEGFASTPSAEFARDVSAPLSNGSLSEDTRSPFVKRSPMWKYIDLEVIPKMRQHPHFRPLEQCPEVQREGIALGLVVTYENLMNSRVSLKMDASYDNLYKNKKIITNLEEHGFDVQHLRTCLEELKRVKKKRKKLLQKKSATEEQALEIEMKSGHLNAELEATNKATTALMLAVHLFDERRASLSEQKEESEIINAKLQRDLRLVEEELMSSDRTLQDLLNGVQ